MLQDELSESLKLSESYNAQMVEFALRYLVLHGAHQADACDEKYRSKYSVHGHGFVVVSTAGGIHKNKGGIYQSKYTEDGEDGSE